MGIQINGQTDTISAVDGALTVSGAELPTVTNLNATGIVTATRLNVGTGGTIVTTTGIGSVGIGTTNPGATLEIFNTNHSLSSGTLSLNSNTTTGAIRFGFKQNDIMKGQIAYSYDNNNIEIIGLNSPAAGIVFYTDFTERARFVGSSGNFGIGTTNPSQKLEVVGGEIKAGRVDSSEEGGQVSFGRATDNATAWYLDVYGSTSTPQLRFVDVSNAAVRASIDNSGNLTLNSGNIVIGTSGKGIDFSATANSSGTMTSELLNDYEEGTWTPIASASTGTITSYTSSGRYTKIGRQVIVKFTISISNQGTASGQYLIFSGLPFLSSNTWTNIGVCREQNINGLLSTAQISGNTTNGSILRYDNSGVIVNGTFQCTICYDVD